MTGPLSHVTVLDLSRVFAGPWAAQMLADFGAEVIKIEHVAGGDDVRRMGVPHVAEDGRRSGETSSFLAMNRGKRSVALDLGKAEAQAVMLELADRADVLIENFKLGNMARFGLDYATLAKRNPRLIYCSITGYGQTGPMAHLPGYDPIFQAMSGVMSVTGQPEGSPGAGPALVGYSISDINGGNYAVMSILAALNWRDAVSGRGQHIDVALLDTQIHAASHMAANWLSSGKLPRRNGTASQITCPWQAFDGADKPIMVAVGNDAQFRRLAGLLGLPELADDPRFATNHARVENAEALVPMLAEEFRRDSAGSWQARLEGIGIPSGPINGFDDVFADPQVRHRELLRTYDHPTAGPVRLVPNPVRLSETETVARRPPPVFAADTDAVLRDLLGRTDDEIAALRASGAIA